MSDDAASGFRKPHALADPEEVRAAITKSGFADADDCPTAMHLCTPLAREFLPGHLSAFPVAGEIAAMSESARAALIEDLSTALIPYTDENGLRLPGVVHIATARAPG